MSASSTRTNTSTTTGRWGGGVTAAAAAATAISGVSSRAHRWPGIAGVEASPASTGIGDGSAATLFAGPLTDGEVDGIARGSNGAATVSAAKVAASSGAARAEGGGVAGPPLILVDSRFVSLPAVRVVPEGILHQPQPSSPPPTPGSKEICPVEVHVNEEGEAVYSFDKSAPLRRGKWSRMEEEYAKRLAT